jgi:hypothetical protein
MRHGKNQIPKSDTHGPNVKGTKGLYKFQHTRDITAGREIAKHGRLQGQGARANQDRSIGGRGGFTNRNAGRGAAKKRAA